MKLIDLLESITRISVDVEFDHEIETGDEVTTIMLTAECVVTTTPDMYGTGDSPTASEVDIRRVYETSTGKAFNVNSLPPKTVDWIRDQASDKAGRS